MLYHLLNENYQGELLMAIDWYILDHGIPFLHTFTWSPPYISIGYLQSLEGLNLNTIKKHGFSIVRRPTGGKAVVHTGDISLAIFLPSHMLPKRSKDAYYTMSEVLKTALENISGINISRTTAEAYQHYEGCFSSSTGYELGIDNQKIAGIAVRKTRKGMLMHASIRMKPFPPFVESFFNPPETPKGTSFASYGISFSPHVLHKTLINILSKKYNLSKQPLPDFKTLIDSRYLDKVSVSA